MDTIVIIIYIKQQTLNSSDRKQRKLRVTMEEGFTTGKNNIT